MRYLISLPQASIVLALLTGGCECGDPGSHKIEPDRSTVNPATHEPYQPKQPKMAQTDAASLTPEGPPPTQAP